MGRLVLLGCWMLGRGSRTKHEVFGIYRGCCFMAWRLIVLRFNLKYDGGIVIDL